MNVLKRNNVNVSGTGEQALVFVHGFGCDQHMWRLVAPAFEARYRVVLLDLLGAGKSDTQAYTEDRYGTLAAHADDVLAVLRELNLRNAVLIGHSVGAMIVLLAAVKGPERIAQIVLVAPSPRFINDIDYIGGFERRDIEELLEAMEQNYMGWSASITPVIMGHADRPELAAELKDSFCRTDPGIARHFARVTFLSDNRADLPKLRTQALVLQCSQDALAPLSVGQYVHENLAGSELVIINTSGHCPHLSAPHDTIAAIDHFLSSVPEQVAHE